MARLKDLQTGKTYSFDLEVKPIVIGKSKRPVCDVVHEVAEPRLSAGISRQHAVLFSYHEKPYVVSMGLENTYVFKSKYLGLSHYASPLEMKNILKTSVFLDAFEKDLDYKISALSGSLDEMVNGKKKDRLDLQREYVLKHFLPQKENVENLLETYPGAIVELWHGDIIQLPFWKLRFTKSFGELLCVCFKK